MKRLSKNKQTLIRIAVAAVLLVTGMTMNHLGMMSVRFGLFWWITLAVYVAGYVIVGYDVIIKAAKKGGCVFTAVLFARQRLLPQGLPGKTLLRQNGCFWKKA